MAQELNPGGATSLADAIRKRYRNNFEHYGVLQSDYTLTNSVAVQKLFNWSTNGALTLPTGIHMFEFCIYLTGMSATSGNGAFHLLGAGTATLARILQTFYGLDNTPAFNPQGQSGSGANTQNSNAAIVGAGTGTELVVTGKGTFDVTVAGTIIPSFALTTAIAAVVKAGSYFGVSKVGETAVAASASWS